MIHSKGQVATEKLSAHHCSCTLCPQKCQGFFLRSPLETKLLPLPQDWYVRYGGLEHLNLEALQRACDRLVQRHSALRTTCSPDAAMREAMDRAAAMWQLKHGSYEAGG